ncbi:MAG: hypothetical protein DWQ10_06760, partial [Calditrichaeota bacterium]
NGLDAAISQYHTRKKDKASVYNFAESELNALGYRLLGEEKLDEAIAILELNNEQYPDSPNTWDSLAEAHLKAGDRFTARKLYKKVLALLPDAQIDAQTKKALQTGAAGALVSLKRKALVPTAVVRDFTGISEHPFGTLHPDAPPETEQFGQLAGVWHCVNHAWFNGRWVSGWPATWAWKYVLDGFAVQDLWFQHEDNFPPVAPRRGRDLSGTNLRMYNPALGKWEMTWFANGANSSSYFTATFENGEIIMIPTHTSVNPKQKSRIIFSNITKDHFDWRREVYDEDKKEWRTTSKITATRVQ